MRKHKSEKILKIDKVKEDIQKYKEIREIFIQESGLNINYEDVELCSITQIEWWQY